MTIGVDYSGMAIKQARRSKRERRVAISTYNLRKERQRLDAYLLFIYFIQHTLAVQIQYM